MKIIIVRPKAGEDNKLESALMEYGRLKGFGSLSIRKTWASLIFIDEKKDMYLTTNTIEHMLDEIGWMGNVMMLTPKQFIEHVSQLKDKKEYPNTVGPISQFIKDLLAKPSRQPCKYCNKVHPDYPCDTQLEHIKLQLNRPLEEIKKICKGCQKPMIVCSCNEHEKECIDCP